MSKWHTIQSSFFAGELAPDFTAQVLADVTRAGLATAINTFITSSGGLRKSPGTRFISLANGAGLAPEEPYTFRLQPIFDANNRWVLACFRDDELFISTSLDTTDPEEAAPWATGSVSRATPVLTNTDFSSFAPNQPEVTLYGPADVWRRNIEVTEFVPDVAPRSFHVNQKSQGWVANAGLTAQENGYTYGTEGGLLLGHRVIPSSLAPRGTEGQQTWAAIDDLDGLTGSAARVVQDVVAAKDSIQVDVKVTASLPYWAESDGSNPDYMEVDFSRVGLRIRVSTKANVDSGPALAEETVMFADDTPRGVPQKFSVTSLLAPGDVDADDEIAVSVGLVVVDFDDFIQTTTKTEKAERGVLAAVRLNTVDAFLTQSTLPVMGTTLASPYTAEQLGSLHFVQSPFDEKELLVFHPDVPPQKVYFGLPGPAWNIAPYAFTAAPAIWSGKYPSTAVGYQGRLVVTGHPEAPETIWASKSNDWSDFTLGSNPDDGLEFTPTARGYNTWLGVTRRLLFGSTTHEYSVDPQSGLLQPNDIAVNTQSSHGHLPDTQPVNVGSDIALPTAGGRNLRLVKYTESSGGFVAEDIGSQARHLLRRRIKRLMFLRDPAESIWLLMYDGTVLVVNREPELDISGFTQLDFGGAVKDFAPLYTPAGETNVALLIDRQTPEGGTLPYLEVITDLRDIESWGYSNSRLSLPKTDNTVGTLSGFGHLEGLVAHVFADGVYTGRQTVTNGEVAVDTAAVEVSVGLPYTFKVSTFPDNTHDPRLSGLASSKRYIEAGVRVLDSGPPLIEGQKLADRKPTDPMDANPPYVGVMDYKLTTRGWSGLRNLTVTDEEPFALTLLAIFGHLSAND